MTERTRTVCSAYSVVVSRTEARGLLMSKIREKTITERAEGKSLGHEFSNIGTGQLDQAGCSCGWKGTVIDDDTFFAHEEWWTHVQVDTHNGTQPFLVLVLMT